MRFLFQLALLGCLTSACATTSPVGGRLRLARTERPPIARHVPSFDGTAAAPVEVGSGAREKVLEAARHLLGATRIVAGGKKYGDDCTGLVRAVYTQVGVDLMSRAEKGDNGVTAIYRFALAHGRVYTGGRPVPGDLVFFKETYDVNKDGRSNDGLTHIGIVDEVEDDGTVTVIHRVARGVVRYRMNTERPTVATDASGRTQNDWLRGPQSVRGKRLAGELFDSYATLLPVESRLSAKR